MANEVNNNESVFINLDENNKSGKGKGKKGLIFFVCVLFTALAVAGIYLYSDASNVKSIKVVGNTYLSDDYIKEISAIDYNSKYIFLFSFSKEAQIKKNDLIEDVSISLGKGNSVIITVKENRIVGYKVDDTSSLILQNGTVIDFNATYIKNLALLPLFANIPSESISSIAQGLKALDDEVLQHVSEVRRVAFTYDYNMVKLVMDDGNYVYSSIQGLPYVNSYLEMVASQKTTSNRCFLIIEEYSRAVNTSCSELDSYTIGYDAPVVEEKGE